MAPVSPDIVACPECDLLQRLPGLRPGEAARCPRCARTLATGKADSLDRTLALALAALIVLLVANLQPLLGLSASGRESSTTILGGAREMWRQGERITALLVAFFAAAAPAIYIGSLFSVAFMARRPPAPRWVGILLRWGEISGIWSMVEVMTLGILVALVKLASLAEVEPGVGIFAVGALVFLLAAMSACFDPREVWTRVRWANGDWPGEER